MTPDKPAPPPADQTPPRLAIVVPCFNEAPVVDDCHQRLRRVLDGMIAAGEVDARSFLCFVDDGSSDDTWARLEQIRDADTSVEIIRLSRNFGHQNALLAGLEQVRPLIDCALTIDADLQQDEQSIPRFVARFREGCDIVYGVRNNRQGDESAFKSATAQGFYRLMSLMGVRLLANHADFRLMSRRALDALAAHGERNIFLRGLTRELGFREGVVHFDVHTRQAGYSKCSTRRMVLFALSGITAFSVTPLRFIALIGALFVLFAIGMSCYVLIDKYLYHDAVPGWATIVISLYLIGGLQLLAMGILGEYLGRVYIETKRRPRYWIEHSSLHQK